MADVLPLLSVPLSGLAPSVPLAIGRLPPVVGVATGSRTGPGVLMQTAGDAGTRPGPSNGQPTGARVGDHRDGDEPDTDLQSDEEAQMPPVRTDLRHPARADRPGRRQRQRQAAQRHHCGRDERGDNGLAKPEHGQTPAPGPGGDHGAGRDDQGQVEADGPQRRGGQQTQQRHGGDRPRHNGVGREQGAGAHCEAGTGEPRQRPYEHGRRPAGLQCDEPERRQNPSGRQCVVKSSDASRAFDDGDHGDGGDQHDQGEEGAAHECERGVRPARAARPPPVHIPPTPSRALKAADGDERR